MTLPETPPDARQADNIPDLIERLAALPHLEGLDPHLLRAIAEEFVWFSLPGGQMLFHRDDSDDSLYLVLSGRLGAFLPNDHGKEVLIRQMTAGETVGEMALLSGQPRSATVLALRDSELAQLSKAAFTKLVDEHPRSLRFITDLLVRRLQQPPRLTPSMQAPGTVAIVPLDRECAALGFAQSLCKAFEGLGFRACALDHSSGSRPLEWFNALEDDHDIVIYEADFDASQWTKLSLRQADRVMLLASATRPLADLPPTVDLVLQNPQRAPLELVIYRTTEGPPSQTLSLMRRFDAALHHHVRAGVPRDYRRLARMISGHAIGLVLSGGGARGLSHVGVICALHEAGVEIDLFGGTSMGAIVAGGAALEWSTQDLRRHFREAFFDDNPVSDYTLPIISLVRGRKTTSFLRRHFGNSQIEDLLYSYFCVSTNLTAGALKIHRTGPLWLATRASVAIPGVLPPVIDGSDILIDGGILNNLPIDIMGAMRRGPIVASDVTSNSGFKATIDDIDQRSLWQLAAHARRGTPNIVTVLMASATASSFAQGRDLRAQAHLLIEPPLKGVSMLDWKAFDRVVEAGYRHTLDLLEQHKGSLLPPA